MTDPRTPPARLLDLTRLVSRVGRGPWTGIDRVEAAYLARLQGDPVPLFGLVRRPFEYVLLDRNGITALAARLRGRVPWGAADLRAQLHRRANPAARAADADLRRLAIGRCGHRGLARMLLRHLPAQSAWLNVGHSNLGPEVFGAVHALGGRATILVHDTIPLDWPAFQRPGTVEAFARRMRAVADHADLVICPSRATEADVARHLAGFGRIPPILTALPGVDVAEPDFGTLPASVDPNRAGFVTVGTIEPRKNHSLLLDIWDHLAATLPEAEVPALHIIGARGWANASVFARLDGSPLMGRHVFEHGRLQDGTVAAMVVSARALLMPSVAEGFGLPPAEARALGTPVIATDLPVYRETLGNNPVYLDGTDMYSWTKEILGLARGPDRGRLSTGRAAAVLPTWQDHFNLVLKVT